MTTGRVADRILRLDAELRARFPQLSRREIRLAIATAAVRVNGKPARKGDRVQASDRITIGPLLDPPPPPRDVQVGVLHKDSQLIVLDKPPGVPTTARRLSASGSVAGFLLRHFPELASVTRSPLEAGLVHRLDGGTSGVLLVARSPQAWAALRKQFRERTVEKEYLALVCGRLAGVRHLRHRLAHDRRHRGRMTARDRMPAAPVSSPRTPRRAARSWTATARVTPLASAAGVTFVAVRLLTGVTHQIRVQLSAIGHPIVGDALYGAGATHDLGVDRVLLHAAALAVSHPADGARRRFSSPLPADFAHALARVGIKNAPRRRHREGR